MLSVGRDTEKQHVTIHSNIHVNFGFIFRGQRHSQGESRGCKGEGFRRSGKQTYFRIFTTSYFQICCRAYSIKFNIESSICFYRDQMKRSRREGNAQKRICHSQFFKKEVYNQGHYLLSVFLGSKNSHFFPRVISLHPVLSVSVVVFQILCECKLSYIYRYALCY